MRCSDWLRVSAGAVLLAGCASAPPAAPTPGASARAPAGAEAAPAGDYATALELLRANRTAEAEAALQAAVAAHPRASGPLTNLGILYARTNRKPQAREAFARAAELNPANAVAHNWNGVLAREAGDFEAAERAYRAALAADPKHAPALLNLAFLYDVHLKRPVEALAAYREYQALTGGKDPRVAIWIGELEASTGAAPAAQSAAGGTSS